MGNNSKIESLNQTITAASDTIAKLHYEKDQENRKASMLRSVLADALSSMALAYAELALAKYTEDNARTLELLHKALTTARRVL